MQKKTGHWAPKKAHKTWHGQGTNRRSNASKRTANQQSTQASHRSAPKSSPASSASHRPAPAGHQRSSASHRSTSTGSHSGSASRGSYRSTHQPAPAGRRAASASHHPASRSAGQRSSSRHHADSRSAGQRSSAQRPTAQRPTAQRPTAQHSAAQRSSHSSAQRSDFPAQQQLHASAKYPLRVVPLGGLEEVGKNMMVFEYGQDIMIVDMGYQFPEEDMLGVDYVLPDVSYLEDKKDRIRGVVVTHGHLDHIGGIPYLLNKLGNPPIYATKLTIGLIQKRLDEFDLTGKAKLIELDPRDQLKLGPFELEFFRVNHSIPDGIGMVINTPAGLIVHSGDFKFDFSPADKKPADFAKLATLSKRNVLALFSDSTNALKPGYTPSEKQIGETLEGIIKNTEGRIIIASFSSLIGRIQQIITLATKHKRQVFVSGRSMIDNINIAKQLKYIEAPPGLVRDIKSSGRAATAQNALILTTGSQGEAVSALTRMAMGEHAQVKIKPGDTIVLSSSPIIGNERAINTVINNLCQLGAKVISNQIMDVHTSGHAQQEDLKLMMNLVQPKYLVPIHGELYMRSAHAQIAQELGMTPDRTLLVNNGDVLAMNRGVAHKTKEKVPSNYIMVDGIGVGDLGAQVLMERQIMAENGILVILFKVDGKSGKLVGAPDVISRGFIYMRLSAEVIEEVTKLSTLAYAEIKKRDPKAKRKDVKNYIRSRLDRHVHNKLEKRPLVLPVLVNV